MAITQEQVDYVAHLSRLALSDEEKNLLAQQLDDILQAVDKLNELDTEGVEPLVHMGPEKSVIREDAQQSSLDRSEALRNAPERENDCFKVPRIID